MNEEKERADFEAHITSTKPRWSLARDIHGVYISGPTYHRWEGWLARAALDKMPELMELPEATSSDPTP